MVVYHEPVAREAVLVREEMNLEFRIEAQNAFNHPVFGTPNTTRGRWKLRDDHSTVGNGPREMQLALKFNF